MVFSKESFDRLLNERKTLGSEIEQLKDSKKHPKTFKIKGSPGHWQEPARELED
jgi:hypothetical protein